ncbi:MAG: ABC transporter permease [Clostridia bacterium]|nr:ABC transporter permease [Clostridia bacterium]
MKLVVSAPLLVVSAALCLLTTVISAYIPAKRAMTIPAIDAIRQNRDVKLSKKEIKTSPLTAKLFGFEGMMAAKNFKRNRKRYRATVVSLFLSVVLFISASSFCAYLKDSVNTFNYEDTGADLYYRGSEVDAGRREELFELLSSAEGVKHASYCIQRYAHVFIDTDDLDGDFKEMLSQADLNGANYEGYLCVAFADDGYFREVCRDNGIDAERYFDPEKPACLIYNKISGMDGSSGKAGTRWRSVKVLEESRLPVTATDVSIRTIDGYELESTSVSNGETEYIFYPKKTLDEFYSGLTDTLDKSEALIVKGDDIQLKVPITIDGTIKDHIIGLSSQIPAVVFPYSMIKAVYGAELGGNMIDGYDTYCEYSLQVNNHAKAFDDLVKLLDENGFESEKLIDNAEHLEKVRMAVTVVNVFAYGFIIIISLIAVANVFNTISTNILLRRREFAMLKSIGMSRKGFRRMLNFECIIYGFKGLIYGLPAAILVTFLIYRVTTQAFDASFYVPWYSVCIAVGSVFAVVFATMLYAAHKMRRDDPAEALKNENL